MRPDDANGHRPPGERPLRVLVIAGSDRRQYNCPGVDSKARALALRMERRLPQDVEIDVEDLGNPDLMWDLDLYARLDLADAWVNAVASHVGAKGAVPPGRYRAFGYDAPGHRLADLRLKWREARLQAGLPVPGTSPAEQQARGLNADTGWSAKSSEGEKRRK